MKYLGLKLKHFFHNFLDYVRVARYNAWKIFWHSNTEPVQVFIAMASIVWAVLLLVPGDSFSRPTYTIMRQFAGEETWAWLFLLQGFAGTWVVLLKSRNSLLIILDCILGCTLWTGSCAAMMLSVYPPPVAISAEIIAAWFSWWLLLRLPINLNK